MINVLKKEIDYILKQYGIIYELSCDNLIKQQERIENTLNVDLKELRNFIRDSFEHIPNLFFLLLYSVFEKYMMYTIRHLCSENANDVGGHSMLEKFKKCIKAHDIDKRVKIEKTDVYEVMHDFTKIRNSIVHIGGYISLLKNQN